MSTRTRRRQVTYNKPLPERLRALPDSVVSCELGLMEIIVGPPTSYLYSGPRCSEVDHRGQKLKPIARCGSCGRLFCQAHILNHPDCRDGKAPPSLGQKEGLWLEATHTTTTDVSAN